MTTWKVAPALAAGCAAILNPSKLASISSLELGEICREVGLPPGALNILTGLGHEAGSPSVSHPDVDKIAFTGSCPTGLKIMTAAAQLVKLSSGLFFAAFGQMVKFAVQHHVLYCRKQLLHNIWTGFLSGQKTSKSQIPWKKTASLVLSLVMGSTEILKIIGRHELKRH